MQPCGGGGDGEAVGAVLQPQGGPAGQASSEAPPTQGSLMLFYELGPAGEAEAEADGEPAGGESAGSPGGGLEDLDDEDENGAQSGGRCKSCTYQGCSETTTQVAKQRKPWMCKRHRNKMYKDKYKRKKSDQALGGGGTVGPAAATTTTTAAAQGGGGAAAATAPASSGRAEDCTENTGSASKQRTGSIGDRPAKPTLLEQVLNHKRLSLLRSPEVVNFLQKRQQLLSQQALEQRQQQFSGAPV
ncbi:regulatory factor X-associated protein [Heteronotia binoei]|uniref:regulatory factor X-associated protein n=1 Tax=Heteronotia binoei TaxID=13085 RepID=UPI00292DFE57|nr:regulatory factor X-associated protein [Heteronotia binoei]